MDLGISGRVAFVTGAGRGIGQEICTTLAAEGVHIAVNDLFQERAPSLSDFRLGSLALHDFQDLNDSGRRQCQDKEHYPLPCEMQHGLEDRTGEGQHDHTELEQE